MAQLTETQQKALDELQNGSLKVYRNSKRRINLFNKLVEKGEAVLLSSGIKAGFNRYALTAETLTKDNIYTGCWIACKDEPTWDEAKVRGKLDGGGWDLDQTFLRERELHFWHLVGSY